MSTITGIVIPADQTFPVITVEIDMSDYHSIQEVVGGFFQVIDLPRPPYVGLYMHEEGKILNLPINERATQYLYSHRSEFVGYDVLVGDVLLLGAPDGSGEATSVPPQVIKQMVNANA